MADTSGRYADLAELQSRVTDSTAKSDELRRTLAAASKGVEDHCHRVFTLASSATARVYRPVVSDAVTVDDIADTTGLTVETGTDGTFPDDVTSETWVEPANANLKGRPFEVIEAPRGTFPMVGRPSVRVTAVWGWPAVPENVTEAVLLLAARYWMRRQSPTGITGAGELGVIRVSSRDPDVAAMLRDYVRSVF